MKRQVVSLLHGATDFWDNSLSREDTVVHEDWIEILPPLHLHGVAMTSSVRQSHLGRSQVMEANYADGTLLTYSVSDGQWRTDGGSPAWTPWRSLAMAGRARTAGRIKERRWSLPKACPGVREDGRVKWMHLDEPTTDTDLGPAKWLRVWGDSLIAVPRPSLLLAGSKVEIVKEEYYENGTCIYADYGVCAVDLVDGGYLLHYASGDRSWRFGGTYTTPWHATTAFGVQVGQTGGIGWMDGAWDVIIRAKGVTVSHGGSAATSRTPLRAAQKLRKVQKGK